MLGFQVCYFPVWLLSVQPINFSLTGNCRFVSATFRLFKVPESSRAGPGQVIYNGGIVGHEQELVFDANFTFKVRGGTLGLPRVPSSPGLQGWGWGKADEAASSVILGVNFARGDGGWEQRGFVNQERCKQGWGREPDQCTTLG